MTRLAFILAAWAAILCWQRAAQGEAASPIVFAAASLKGPLDQAALAFHAVSGVTVTISYAGSNALAKQIEQGAPADVFISADEAWADYLVDRNLLKPASRVTLLTNALALIAPGDSAVTLVIQPGFDLAGALAGGKLAVADPAAVPAGKYAKDALTALGVWDSVSASVVGAENVRAALALVARAEASMGIVYVTDANAETQVKTVGVFPSGTHSPIVYPAALTAASSSNEAAAFLTFLQGEEAGAIFAAAGFGKPAP